MHLPTMSHMEMIDISAIVSLSHSFTVLLIATVDVVLAFAL